MKYAVGDVITEDGYFYSDDRVTWTVQMWNIADILHIVTESADFGEFEGSSSMWAYIFASKGGDAWTPALIERILEEGFTDPICIYRTETGGWGLGNGHHRLVAAVLLGLDEIPVLVSDTLEAYFPNASEGINLETEYDLQDPDTADMIYAAFAKIYKKLRKQEEQALDEEASLR